MEEYIRALLGRPLVVHRVLIEITGSLTAAMFLSQAMYWTDKVKDKYGSDEFFKTIEQWEKDTGLTRREQEGAREKLGKLGILSERHEYLKHRLWYKVNYNQLGKLLKNCHIPRCTKPPSGEGGNRHLSSNIEYIGNNTKENTEIEDYRNQIEKDFGGDENEESESSLVNENPENEVRPTLSVPGSLSSSSRPRSGSRWKKRGGREIELFGPLDYSASSREMAEFQEVWNGVFVLQKIVSLKGREPLVREAMKDEWWRNNYREGIKKIAASKFCRGENKLHWKATVEWFLRPTTLARVLEGQYDGKNPPAQFNPEDFTRETI